MEEPSDSSRQRAPDLTTFLVTSYEHLRLKTPLISRIHRARLKFRPFREVVLNFTSIQKYIEQDEMLHGLAHKAFSQKLDGKGKLADLPPRLWKIEHIAPDSNPAIFFNCKQMRSGANCIIATMECWRTRYSAGNLLHARFTHEVTDDPDR